MALPITDPLHPEKSMLAFASRFVMMNGVGRIANLCAHLGLDLKGLAQGEPSQIQRLAELGGIDESEFVDRVFQFSDDGFVRYREERLAYSFVHRGDLRACPFCMTEDWSTGKWLDR